MPHGVILLVLAACRCTPGQPPGRAQPVGHFDDASTLLRAVEAGDLVAATEAARRLDGGPLVEGASGVAGHALEDLHAAVGFLVSGTDAAEAGVGLARVAEACGSCHVAEGVMFQGAESTGHAGIAESLWWGIVGGEPAFERDAAARLAVDPPRARQRAGSEEAAQAVAEAARATALAGSTVDLFAVLVGACSTCHGSP